MNPSCQAWSYALTSHPQQVGELLMRFSQVCWQASKVAVRKTAMAAPQEVSVAAVASVMSELASISSLKEEQRTTMKAFLNIKHVFFYLDWFQLVWFTKLAPLMEALSSCQSHPEIVGDSQVVQPSIFLERACDFPNSVPGRIFR